MKGRVTLNHFTFYMYSILVIQDTEDAFLFGSTESHC